MAKKQDNSLLTFGGIILGVIGGYLIYRHVSQKFDEQNNEIVNLRNQVHNQNRFIEYQFNEYNNRIVYLENKASQTDYYKSLVEEASKRAKEKQAKRNTPYIN